MLFSEVVGQDEIKKSLIQTVKSGRISHAQLFTGSEGSGNLPMALAYAQYINCLNQSDIDSCGKCASCIKFQKLAHPDLNFAYPVATSSKIKAKPCSLDYISEWREALLQHPYLEFNNWISHLNIENKQAKIYVKDSDNLLKAVAYKNFEAKYKVVIIWHAEKMNTDAANKLLKLIEEPEPKTLILLLSDDSESIIKTILSRTQQIKFNSIDLKSLSDFIQKEDGLDKEKSDQIAAFSEGNFNIAKKLVQEGGNKSLYFDTFKNWMRICFKGKLPPIIDWVEEISAGGMGREERKTFLMYCLRLMRESIIKNYADDSLLRLSEEEKLFLESFSPYIHSHNIMILMDLINKSHYHIERNANPKTVFFNLSVNVIKLLRTKNVNL